jgi:hypothetical protein
LKRFEGWQCCVPWKKRREFWRARLLERRAKDTEHYFSLFFMRHLPAAAAFTKVLGTLYVHNATFEELLRQTGRTIDRPHFTRPLSAGVRWVIDANDRKVIESGQPYRRS